MRRPSVSVVVPVRNGERFLFDALASVAKQEYPVHECIVVDDGSTDSTREVAESFDGLVTYERISPSGVSTARNRGFELSSGDLTAFLDADDMWLPEKLGRQIELFESQEDLGLIYTGLRLIDASGAPLGTIDAPSGAHALRNTLLIEGPGVSVAQTGLVPRHVFEAIGGFDERLSTSADADLACRVALRYPVAPVPDHLVCYRMHDGQMHLDPTRTEHDRLILFDKMFGAPELSDELAGKRRRAVANLYLSLANRYRKTGDWKPLAVCLARALLTRPDRVVAAVRRLGSTSR